MKIFYKVFIQSLQLSFEELRSSKLRAFLSLLGIAIGIICVISVRTAVYSLEKNIQDSFASFGDDIIYIQKWPWQFGGADYPWWRYFNRPSATIKEMEQLRERMPDANAICLINFSGGKNLKFNDNIVENVTMKGATYDYLKIKDMEFTEGRYFTETEVNNNYKVCLVGGKVADALFEGIKNRENLTITADGIRLSVVGIIKKQGEDLFGLSIDNNIIVPYGTLSLFANENSGDPLLAVTPKPGKDIEEFKYELKGKMRSIRRLSPLQDDNFALNRMTVVTEQVKSVFSFVNIAGIFIGLFSLIVGGFGIANIMFVSVKERTNIIGIKKALGAHRSYILTEFLLEAVMLCIIGGVIGLIVVITLFKLGNYALIQSGNSLRFYITWGNLLLGVGISILIGIFAGFIPAYSASKMKPVDAIRGN